jgi:hypothetical protein
MLLRNDPANVVLGGVSMGALMQLKVVSEIERCATTIRGVFELDVRWFPFYRQLISQRLITLSALARFVGWIESLWMNEAPHFRFSTTSTHMTSGYNYDEYELEAPGDEMTASRRALHTIPDEMYRLPSSSHLTLGLDCAWDIAAHIRATCQAQAR